jgi:hypothetical protein
MIRAPNTEHRTPNTGRPFASAKPIPPAPAARRDLIVADIYDLRDALAAIPDLTARLARLPEYQLVAVRSRLRSATRPIL